VIRDLIHESLIANHECRVRSPSGWDIEMDGWKTTGQGLREPKPVKAALTVRSG
jgi:hypothetical protein